MGVPPFNAPGEHFRAEFVAWRHDGDKFWIATSERDGRNIDVYEYSTRVYTRTRVFDNADGWEIGGISGDGRAKDGTHQNRCQ